ncbi:aminotransferase class I/II-fold pyridoxal phosphate-dependent enzyme [Liquorilactobacillus mali]|uniref:Aminotransferase n=1 Tax=Liquorilactobacillus mali KCTC 3596 = DSM 20444 TaxID=1046596 RepID=J1F5R8_9LACO|nr:aminotransferase class I/II-fold pyridoxal phosphate-dependent enzyme [Liquorilactobacillus mali]EJF02059.1 Aromatic amino acid aminotransferase [Liquorilactobacillus mali KCTC 3596 = DSM 20444]KRN09946.1 aromatic amino acid aminotransferase [Liquorilactobacillus mali KCTC 3596 = DSM 20444]MDC7953686.1 aminotransferase class I/II-fold pyridoxal phosphate-dependent enzyme [Liquorilactobacillus mali]MDV7758131.1 aminotransferase class I/II-fold pyridoxal phosphate-dependent enzyme [Liquorilact
MESLVKSMKKELAMLQPSDIRSFDEFASKIPGIIKFTMGEPDFATPEHIKKAAIKSIEANQSHYAPSNGIPELLEAASHFLSAKYDQHYDPENEIIVTNGATEAIYTALTSILNPGDKVIIPTPIFPLYIAITILNQATPIFVNTSKTGFKLTPEDLKATLKEQGDSVKAVVLNYPSNPTGVTYTQGELDGLADVLRNKPIFAICDEIYSEINYKGQHASMVHSLREQTILLNGVSKSHAMTGWRIGVMCAPKEITAELGKVHQFTITTTSTMTQKAAAEAFANGFDDGPTMKKEYRKRRDYLLDKLVKLGFECAQPDGAFYLFAKIPEGLIQDDKKFIYDLAEKGKVAVISGSSFGPGGEGYIRISYAASMEDIVEAMKRLAVYVKENREG